MVIQGALDYGSLDIKNLNFSGEISVFRPYLPQVQIFFEKNLDSKAAARPYFDYPEKVQKEYEIYTKNKKTYDFKTKTAPGGPLSGKGKSADCPAAANHHIECIGFLQCDIINLILQRM